MAKDKKQSRSLGGSQNAGQNDAGSARSQDIDVSTGSLAGKASDSDLDIQALLRKYMPEYENEDEDSVSEGTGVLSRLKKSAEDTGAADDAVEFTEDLFILPDEESPEVEEDSVLSALDAAFSELMEEESAQVKKTAAEKLEADDFMFTDDILAPIEDDGELEDEEGIYEDDEERISRKPRRQKERGGLFGFGKRAKKNKAVEEMLFAEDAPETEEYPVAEAHQPAEEEPELFVDIPEEIPDGQMGEAMMESLGLEAEPDDELTNTLRELGLLQMDEEPEMEVMPAPVEPTEPAEPEAAEDVPLSDADMLRMAEELLENAVVKPEEAEAPAPAAEEEAVPAVDDEFDPTDINLMVAFGMDDGSEGKKKAARTARQLGDKLENEKVAREGQKVKLDRPEYVDKSQNAAIEKSYRLKMIGLWIRLGLCGVFTVLLMLFENIEVIAKLLTGTAKQFGGVFDPAIYPVVYAMVSLQLMLLACLCAHEQILKGFGYLLRGVPRPESMTALLTVAGILYTVVISRITVQSDEPVMFNFTVAAAAFMTLIGAVYTARREMMNFKVISSPNPKHVVCRVSDDCSRGEATAFSEEEDICDVMRIEKTDFVDGFFTRLCTPDAATNVFMSCAMGIMVAAAVLFGIFASIRGGSAVEVARVVCVSMMTVAPLSVYLSLSYPFYRANVAASEYESAIIGEASLAEYSNASIVTFDDNNVFPSYGVKVQNIRIFNNARIDRVLYYASSVFAKAGGPLRDVFEVATLEVGHSENVQIFDTEAGFLAAEVDGVNIIFGSGEALIKKGLKIRRSELEDDVDLSEELSIMYMFREDKLVAKMYIQYVMDSDIELILGQFQNSGLYVCVRTYDPNIDERMIARKVKMKRMPLKVIRYNDAEEVDEHKEKKGSGLVTSGSPKSLLQIISYCDKVLHTKKTNIALAILAIIIGAAIMLLLVLSGSIGIVNSLYIILYQLLWLIPMLLSTRMFIR
ncbi:MAG: hypothetical protein IKY52_08525 [Clostridia bacterium]|nr:hypothetical protein [Clostridia bacterium]